MNGSAPPGRGREALERAYGLALGGLSDDQLDAAAKAATAAGSGPDDPGDPAWLERLLDHLPIDESWLFRDEGLWTWLRDQAGPPLLSRALSSGRTVRALSIGCSAGQEAFTVAILFQHLLERAGVAASTLPRHLSVLGVDPSPARIARAREGAVGAWSVERCAADWLRGRVRLEDSVTGRYRIDAAARAACRFEIGNLLTLAGEGTSRLGGFDLVLCRNVFIYFRAPAARELALALAAGLDDGALLGVSAAEAHLLDGSELLERTDQLGVARVRRSGASSARQARAAARRRIVAPRAAVATGPARAPRGPAPAPERAEVLHDPGWLLARLALGRELLAADEARGGEVLRDLLETMRRLPQDAEVPAAPGLSVAQLATAVRLLMDGGTGR